VDHDELLSIAIGRASHQRASHEFVRQLIELAPLVDNRCRDIGLPIKPSLAIFHMAWRSVSYICLMDDITRALAE